MATPRKKSTTQVDSDDIQTPVQVQSLTMTFIKQVQELIRMRSNTVKDALNSEISIDMQPVQRQLLAEMGFMRTADEVEADRRKLKRDLERVDFSTDAVLRDLETRARNINLEVETAIEQTRIDFDRRIEELKREQKRTIATIQDSRTQRLEEAQGAINVRRDEIVDVAQPGLRETLTQLDKDLPKLRKAEEEVRAEVDKRVEQLRLSRSRLTHLLADKETAAMTALLRAKTPDEAAATVEIIPTVAQMIKTFEKQGLGELLELISPGMTTKAIAAPSVAEQAKQEMEARAVNPSGMVMLEGAAVHVQDASPVEDTVIDVLPYTVSTAAEVE